MVIFHSYEGTSHPPFIFNTPESWCNFLGRKTDLWDILWGCKWYQGMEWLPLKRWIPIEHSHSIPMFHPNCCWWIMIFPSNIPIIFPWNLHEISIFCCLPSGNDVYSLRTWSHDPVEMSWVFPWIAWWIFPVRFLLTLKPGRVMIGFPTGEWSFDLTQMTLPPEAWETTLEVVQFSWDVPVPLMSQVSQEKSCHTVHIHHAEHLETSKISKLEARIHLSAPHLGHEKASVPGASKCSRWHLHNLWDSSIHAIKNFLRLARSNRSR